MRPTRSLLLAALLGFLTVSLSGCPGCDHTEPVDWFEPRDMGSYVFDGAPELEAPDRLLFLGLVEGETATRTAEIRNVGRTGLELKDFLVEGPFDLHFPEYLDAPPSRLSPGQTLLAQVSYTAFDEEPRMGTLTVISDDPENEAHEIALLANVELPCLTVEPSNRLRFGSVVRGERAERTLRLTNCSEVVVAEVALVDFEDDGGFRLLDDGDRAGVTRVIQPGQSAVVPIEFHPQEVRPYRGSITVLSEDEVSPEVVVELEGDGAPPHCPTAVITASSLEGNAIANPLGTLQGEPLEIISLDGSQSFAHGGASIAEYEWALVGRPADTVVDLGEDGDVIWNSLYLELAGIYEIELHVYDTEGTRSCEPARLTVEAVSGDGLHIQLVWDTPNDPNRHNNSGTDLDLHFRHENGQWNASPWDCYWMNMNPNWGDENNDDMNPSLDIDHIHGWGPENINLKIPENGVTYGIGVYYFSDHGYGGSYATVRVFIDGVLQLEHQNRWMTNWQFWHVANITWPDTMFTIYDQITQGFPN